MRNGISMEFMHVIMEQIAANVVIRIEYLGEWQSVLPDADLVCANLRVRRVADCGDEGFSAR